MCRPSGRPSFPISSPFSFEDRRGHTSPLADPDQVEFLHDVHAVAFRVLYSELSVWVMVETIDHPLASYNHIRRFLAYNQPTLMSSKDLAGDSVTHAGDSTCIRISHDLVEAGALAIRTKYDKDGSAYRRAVLGCAAIVGLECQYWVHVSLLGKREGVWKDRELAWKWEERVFGGRVLGLEAPTMKRSSYAKFRIEGTFRGQFGSVCAVVPKTDQYCVIPDWAVDAVVKAERRWEISLPFMESSARKSMTVDTQRVLDRRSIDHRHERELQVEAERDAFRHAWSVAWRPARGSPAMSRRCGYGRY